MEHGQSCPVSKLDKLLLATDRSSFSEGAINAAITFAKHCSSKLSIMTVVEKNPEYETAGAELLQKDTEEAARYLASLKVRALENIPSCETILRRGDNASGLIVKEAAQKEIDMIVVGRRGRSGLEKVFLGSAAAKVIGHAPCKVLVVPREAKIGFKNILIATDGSEHARIAATESIEIAKRCGSHLIVISVVLSEDGKEKSKENADEVVLASHEAGIYAESIVHVGKPREVIVATAKGMGADLIVMGAYGKTGLRRLLMGSTTEKVIGLADCAILVAK